MTIGPILLSLALLRGADAVTTVQGFRRGYGDVSGFDAQSALLNQAIGAGAQIGGVWWLDRHDHPKAARMLGWIAIGVEGWTVARNARRLSEGVR